MVTKVRLPRSAPDARREDIVCKASDLFLEHGFAATSMSTVARAVGGSKATLYKYFPTKEALFEAVMEQRSHAVLESILSDRTPRQSPRAFLTMVGEELLTGIHTPEAVALCRVVMGDCVRSPEIGRAFFAMGPDRLMAIVTAQLQAFARNQDLDIGDPQCAAEDFLALLRGEAHFRVLAGVRDFASAAEIKAHVARVVDLVLRLWQPDRRPS